MGQLKIVAAGNTPQTQAQAKGKLFEKLMADVLRHFGYRIDSIPNVNYAGMEIDIEGRHTATDIPLYAECKCYETEVDSTKLQAFYGKFMTRWQKDKRSHGLFIALPGVNSHAKGFYKENINGITDVTVRLYEQEEVLKAMLETLSITNPDAIARVITPDIGKPGDWLLLYTDKGIFWVQYVIPKGTGIASRIAIFDGTGDSISDKTTYDYLTNLYSELNDFEKISLGSAVPSQSNIQQELEEIVEVRGSSECFEYQFPASPEHFVGREQLLKELDQFVLQVLKKETSSRGILFEANSGWGKSSLVLTSVARLQKMGHFAVAIDSRSASSSQFILRVLDYAFNKFKDFNGLISNKVRPEVITGFEGAVKAVLNIGKELEQKDKLMFIFLDQFEHVFFLQDALKRIRDLFLKICDTQTNIILGFSWKTDLIGLTSEFPYQLRDSITDLSRRIILHTFSEVETNALLDKLAQELHTSLRKDLRFFLSEFSQGYPWLLKKLCAHVKSQRLTGVQQSDIARSLLNVEELFQEDLCGLSAAEEEVLHQVAKAAPISILELGEKFRPELVQSLVHRRLIVRIGSKYDVYWDIFRDYLNSGRLPIQENYILRAQRGSVLNAIELLINAKGSLDVTTFQNKAQLSEKSFYNVAKDMGLLGLAKLEHGKVTLQIKLPNVKSQITNTLRDHLQNRLCRNRLIWRLSKLLEEKKILTLLEASKTLEVSCPYISASAETWLTYARVFAGWMDYADLAIFDDRNKELTQYEPGRDIRARDFTLPRRRGAATPRIQYKPVEDVLVRIVKAIKGDGVVDWTGLRRSTIFKALGTLEDLGFIIRKRRSIQVLPKGIEFVSNPDKRPELFAEGARSMPIFVTFVMLLDIFKDAEFDNSELALKLKQELRADWQKGTAETNVKIMLNWARYTKLVPVVFGNRKKRRKKIINPNQISLL